MPTIGRNPEPSSRLDLPPVAPVIPVPAADPVAAPPPQLPVPHDRFQAEDGFAHLEPASPQQVRNLFTDKGATVPDRIAVAGGDLVIGWGNELIRANLDQLAGLIAPQGPGADTVLGRSLLVFEAANRAHLPQGAIKAVLKGFADALQPPQSLDSATALHQALPQISMASLVEAYVQSKDGLATDVRRVASFADDAFHPDLAGGTVPAMANRTVGRAIILDRQKLLDAKLHDFSDAFSSARFNGDYSAAFDQLQDFFRACAGATDSLHWRMRAADPASACPPLPARAETLPHSRLLDAAMQVPMPKAVLVPTAVARRTRWQSFTAAVRTAVAVVGNLFTRSAPPARHAAVGLVGIAKAANLVSLEGSNAAFGRVAYGDGGQPSVTEAETLLVGSFGDQATAMAERAAAKGYLPELVEVATASQGHPGLPGKTLADLVGSHPTAGSLSRLALTLRITKDRQVTEPQEVKALAKRLLNDPLAAQLAPLVNDSLSASHKPSTIADLTTVLDKARSEKATGKGDLEAMRNALRPAVMAWVGDNDATIFKLFNDRSRDLVAMRQLIRDLRALPPHVHPKAKLAIVMQPPHERDAAMARAERLTARDSTDLGLNNGDVHRLLTELPPGAAFDRCLDLMSHATGFWPKQTMDGLIAASKKLADKQVPPISQDQLAQALRAVYGVNPPPLDSLTTLLDSRATTIGIGLGAPYVPTSVAPVTLPPTMTTLPGFQTTGAGGDKSVSPTQWFTDGNKERRLVKLADPLTPLPETEPYAAAMERQISVLGNQLGLPVNVVQLMPASQLGEAIDLVAAGKLQEEMDHRARMEEPPLSPDEQQAFIQSIKDAYTTMPYASVHTPVGQGSIALWQFVSQVGLSQEHAEYRAEPSLHCDSGQGGSSWMRADAAAYMQQFRDGITRQILDDGTSIPSGQPAPPARTVTATHTYRIANPEVLDQVLAFDRLTGNADRHGGNLLLVPQDDPDGTGTTYTVHLIDHGRSFFSGMDKADAVAERLEALSGYLKTLTLPENATHAGHVVPLLRTFANLSATQLLDDPYRDLPADAVDPQAKLKQQAILAAEQQLIRQFLPSLPA